MSRKTKAGVIGAITAMAAAVPAVAPAQTFADLLQPIPNAVERLKLADAQDAQLIRTRMQAADHHHHAAAAKKPAADHHHHAAAAKKPAADHHHHAQTSKGAADHHHHAAAAKKPAGT